MLEFRPFYAYEWRVIVIAALLWLATLLFTQIIGHKNGLDWFGKGGGKGKRATARTQPLWSAFPTGKTGKQAARIDRFTKIRDVEPKLQHDRVDDRHRGGRNCDPRPASSTSRSSARCSAQPQRSRRMDR